jgi:type II secretion system protein G
VIIPQSIKNRGFTLIELLVVIAIIGLLSSIVLASLSSGRAKARDARRMQDLHQIRNALEMYRSDYNEYPHEASPAEYNSNDADWTWLSSKLVPKYITSLPKDPQNIPTNGGPNYTELGNYSYLYSTGYGPTITLGSDYDLVARLEKPNQYTCPNKDWPSNTDKPDSWCDEAWGVPYPLGILLDH